MTTNAKIGFGNLFQILNVGASPDEWVTVAEVKSITPPSFARDAQDATHTESTEGWREFIPGLKDGGEISVELNFVPDSDTTDLILAQFASDDLSQVRILFADGNQAGPTPTCSSFTCSGVITGFPIEAPIEDGQTATITFKISGKPTFVRATA
jgi:predicted secreted protein